MTNTASANTIAEIAALIGDPARANILSALMAGQALTAGELARHAGVTAQTTSGHLARLTGARMIALEKQGRHRYYRIASIEVARAIEALSVIAAAGPARHHPIGPRDAALRRARTCYDHIAGRLGLALADAMQERDLVVLSDGAGLITEKGLGVFAGLGLDLDIASRRPLCRTCLDWSERRHHVAGRLGAALLHRLLERGWLTRVPESRALEITRTGLDGFSRTFGIARDRLA